LNIYLRLVYRNIRANLDRASLFFELIFPLFFIFVQGFGLNGIVPPFDVGNGAGDQLLPCGGRRDVDRHQRRHQRGNAALV